MSLPSIHACTGIVKVYELPDEQKKVTHSRTVDFPIMVGTHGIIENRGETWTSLAPGEEREGGYYSNGEEGFSWEAEKGCLRLSCLGKRNSIVGFNESKFLSSSYTLFSTEWQTVSPEMRKSAISADLLQYYIVSTCGSVAEVHDRLKEIRVWRCSLDDLEIGFPLVHMDVVDSLPNQSDPSKTGNWGVVEYIDGELCFYDNSTTEIKAPGGIANDPPLPGQIANLLNLGDPDPTFPTTKTINGIVYDTNAICHHLKMPGSYGSMDRMARVIQLSGVIYSKVHDSVEMEANMWAHMASVQVAEGVERIPVPNTGIELDCYTRWTGVTNLTDGIMKIRTYRGNAKGEQTVFDINSYNFDKGTDHEPIPIYSVDNPTLGTSIEHDEWISSHQAWINATRKV